ncbi:MAG: DNA repair protein [Maritimibacter sp.]
MKPIPGLFAESQRQMLAVTMTVVMGLAAVLLFFTLGATFGFMPWLEIEASANGQPLENAGIILQVAATALAVTLALFLPANRRIMRLEQSHRDFQMSMDDVVRAYRLSHEADRKRLFKIGSEFDSVRERLEHLREHPELGALEPEILELASQMSFVSRDLADTYSQDKVDRARGFLKQRQQEIDSYLENLAMAQKTIEDLRHWMQQLDAEEAIVERQMTTLEADLMELLPQLGFEIGAEEIEVDETVVPMPAKARPKSPSKTDA